MLFNSRLRKNTINNQYSSACHPLGVTKDVVVSDAMKSGYKGEVINW